MIAVRKFIAPCIAAALLIPAVTESFAEQKGPPTRETMLRRCEQRALWCEQDCDEKQLAGDLTDAQYKKCNEVRPERTTGGGGGDSGAGGDVLDPGAGDPPPSFNPKPYSVPGGGLLLAPD